MWVHDAHLRDDELEDVIDEVTRLGRARPFAGALSAEATFLVLARRYAQANKTDFRAGVTAVSSRYPALAAAVRRENTLGASR